MILANEVRIGNYVRMEKDGEVIPFYQVEGIDIYCMVSADEGKCEWLHPIPITGENLEMLGFYINGVKNFKLKNTVIEFVKNLIHVYYSPSLGFIWGDKGWGTGQRLQINYVHELQNLLFALDKQELILKQE